MNQMLNDGQQGRAMELEDKSVLVPRHPPQILYVVNGTEPRAT
jgi:hypothetical protein